jgi:hypothetical protein
MQRFVVIASACLLLAACGDDNDAGTAPSSLPAVFSAVLSPANEVPPITNAESSARGAVQITFDVTRSGNAVSAATATFYFTLTGLPNETTLVGAHIHNAPQGVTGPIVVDTGILSRSPVALSNGAIEFRSGPVTMAPALAQSIMDNPGGFYFNIHSPLNPGGFTRGQLVRIQ